MSKSLTLAIAHGIRPGAIKASLQQWLGVPISLQNGAFWREWAGTSSWTGKNVTVDQALQLATVWACVRLIAETMATLPLGFYSRNTDGSRTPATSHGLYEILHNQPNADMTAVVFWEVVVASMLLWGNAYIEIVRGASHVIALNFLHPARVVLQRSTKGQIEYRYRDSPGGAERVIPEANMMHLPAFSTDGRIGLSPIAYGVNVMGTSIETDKASAETFRSAMRSPGVLTTNAVLTKEQREALREHINKVSAEGGVMIVETGTGFEKLTFNPVDAELLASRSWNVEEMCRWFAVDPVMIGHGGKDSNWGTGLEQKMIWLVTFTLRKWCVRIEQGVRKNLLTPVERTKFFAEFALEGLLRGDSAARATFYSTMTQNGVMSRDECRIKENLPHHGGNAAVLTVQSNMLPIDKLGMNVTAPTPPVNPAIAHAEVMGAIYARNQPITVSSAAPNITVHPANIKLEPAEVTVNQAPITVTTPDVSVAPANISIEPAAVTVNQAPIIVNEREPTPEEIAEENAQAAEVERQRQAAIDSAEGMTNDIRIDIAASRIAMEKAMGELIDIMGRPTEPVYNNDGVLIGARRVKELKKG